MVVFEGQDRVGNKDETLRFLAIVSEAVAASLGDWAEVVVHDLTDLDHSIVSICGNLTGREIGDSMTDLGLARLKEGRMDPVVNYTSYTEDGKTLKCTSMFIQDEQGHPIAGFCINLNVTPFLLFSRFLDSMAYHEQGPNVLESFSQDLAQMINTTIAESAYHIGKPVSLMTKSDRVSVVKILNEKGVFQLRRSVPLVAERLGVSRKTIYNYLSETDGVKQTAGNDNGKKLENATRIADVQDNLER